MKIVCAFVAVAILGCARAPREKESTVSYEMRGRKTIDHTTGAPPAPALMGKGIIAPRPGPDAALPQFGSDDPIPAVLPAFVGSAIREADGIAPQTANKLVLLALLKARRFADLDRCFGDYQTAFELDARNEYWPSDALDAFRTGDAKVGSLVQEWTATSPRSWAALAARGAHRHALAWLVRGSGYANTVSETAGDAFARKESEAAADLRSAISRRPRFVAAYDVLIAVHRGTAAARTALDDSLRTCPDCFRPRATFLDGLTPEWGGSYEKMAAFVHESLSSSSNPRLKLLQGFAPFSRAMKMRDDGNPVEAMREINEALKAGDLWRVYLLRADIAGQIGQAPSALPDLDRAFELRPQASPLADFRGIVRTKLGMLEGAIQDFDLARKLDPTRPRPDEYVRIADALVRRSNEALATGGAGRVDALREVASRLREAAGAPDPRGATPSASPAPTVEAYADPSTAFHAQLASLPDDYAAYRRIGIPLLNAHRSQELEEVWTAWIARHPDDARGYWERHSAYSQRREIERRDEDLRQACALGHAQACSTQEINAALKARRTGAP